MTDVDIFMIFFSPLYQKEIFTKKCSLKLRLSLSKFSSKSYFIFGNIIFKLFSKLKKKNEKTGPHSEFFKIFVKFIRNFFTFEFIFLLFKLTLVG